MARRFARILRARENSESAISADRIIERAVIPISINRYRANYFAYTSRLRITFR